MPKGKSSKVKNSQTKSYFPKKKRTKERKMKTRGRIVSRKGSKKKLLAYGSKSSSNSNNNNSNSESPPLAFYMRQHLKASKEDPNYFIKISGNSYKNIGR